MVSKLEKLIKQKEALETKIKCESSRDLNQKRKLDTKRKILIGAYYLKKHVDDGTWQNLIDFMDGFLINKTDRNAFDLPEKLIPENKKTKTSL